MTLPRAPPPNQKKKKCMDELTTVGLLDERILWFQN